MTSTTSIGVFSNGSTTEIYNTTSNTTGPPSTKILPYPEWLVIFMWMLTALFSIETILGNLLVLMAYKLERNIRRQLSNKFIVSLAVTDLIIGMEGFPLLTVYVVSEQWPLGEIPCQIWLWLDYTLCLVSILNVLLITVDRYGSVCYPAKYRTWQTRHRVRVFIVGSWIVPSLFFGLMIFAWEFMTGQRVDKPGDCYAPFLKDPYVNMSMYIAYYWTTLVAMSVLYRGIHQAAKALEDKSKARERQTIALLLGQRCMAQVGVGMLMRSSVSDEGQPDSYFHQPAATEVTGMAHDSGYVTATTTTATTATTHTNAAAPIPVIVTESPPRSVSLSSSHKISPSPSAEPMVTSSAPHAVDTDTMGTNGSSKPRQNYLERQGTCSDEEDDASFPLVPLVDEESLASPKRYPNYTNGSPMRRLFEKKRSSLRRVLAPITNAVPRRAKLVGSASLDEEHIRKRSDEATCGKRSQSMTEKRKLTNVLRKNAPTVVPASTLTPAAHQDSACSLEYYGSEMSINTLYGDTSLNSVLEFSNMLTALDSVEDSTTLNNTSITAETDFSINAANAKKRHFRSPIGVAASILHNRRRQANGDLVRTGSSSASSVAMTRSASTSIRSQYSIQTEDNINASPARLTRSNSSCSSYNHAAPIINELTKNLAQIEEHEMNVDANETPDVKEPREEQLTRVGLRAQFSVPIQIKVSPDSEQLPPIIEEDKSVVTSRSEVDSGTYSRRSSAAPSYPGSPPKVAGPRGRHGTKRGHPEKVVHLAVPSSSGSAGGSGGSRRSSAVSTKKRGSRSPSAGSGDLPRPSWHSGITSPFGGKKKARRGTKGFVDDDDDSGGSNGKERCSSVDDSSSDKKGTGWLTTLFNNPGAILHRKRKVTRAEKRARKAFRTITVIVGTFALFWSPYYIVATIYGFCNQCVPTPIFFTTYYLCYLNSSMNPFAYAFANRLFRKTFIRILRGDWRRT